MLGRAFFVLGFAVLATANANAVRLDVSLSCGGAAEGQFLITTNATTHTASSSCGKPMAATPETIPASEYSAGMRMRLAQKHPSWSPQKLERVVREYSLMQVGICLFHEQPDGSLLSRPFNFYVFPGASNPNPNPSPNPKPSPALSLSLSLCLSPSLSLTLTRSSPAHRAGGAS